MKELEKLNGLIELAKLAASRHDERRKYEWKVSFAFWALIVGAIIRFEDVKISWLAGIFISFVGVLIYAFIWLRGVWVANQNDKSLYDFFRKKAYKLLKGDRHRLPRKNQVSLNVGQ